MKISLKGIHFTFMDRSWIWNWPWKRSSTVLNFSSETLNLNFKTISQLAEFCATTEELTNERHKTEGFSWDTLLQQWVLTHYPKDIVIALTDIDVSAKPYTFWSVMSKPEAIAFTKDVVILRCRTLEEMKRITDSIPVGFAMATCFCNGNQVYSNEE